MEARCSCKRIIEKFKALPAVIGSLCCREWSGQKCEGGLAQIEAESCARLRVGDSYQPIFKYATCFFKKGCKGKKRIDEPIFSQTTVESVRVDGSEIFLAKPHDAVVY